MIPLMIVVFSLYGMATVTYCYSLFSRRDGVVIVARWVMVGALISHLAMIGFFCTQKLNPLRDVQGALSLSAFLLAGGYLLATWRTRMGAVGAIIAPLSLALLVTAHVVPPTITETAPQSILGEIHIAMAAVGVAVFGLAAAVATLYVMQETALKNKRIGPLFRKTPPLTTLDEMGRRLIVAGFCAFTLAVGTGLVWLSRLEGDPLRIQYIVSGATWLIFALLIFTRVTVGWRGKRAAWMTVLGFVATVVILLIYMWRRLGGG